MNNLSGQAETNRERGLAAAIRAIRQGDTSQGRKMLVDLLRQDPRDTAAWLWLASTLEDEHKRRECFERVLKIDPQNQAARQGLSALVAGSRAEAPPPTTLQPPLQKRQKSNPLPLVVGAVLGFGILSVAAILLLVYHGRHEIVPVDLQHLDKVGYTLAEREILDLGGEVRALMEGDLFDVRLAVDQQAYNRLFYWTNAEVSGYGGYARARLPKRPEDVNLARLEEVTVVIAFVGPSDPETYAMDITYMRVEAAVSSQDPVTLRLRTFEETPAVPVMQCFWCLTYVSGQCAQLPGCLWENIE